MRNAKQSLGGAFFYNLLGIPVAAGVLYPFTGTLLSPLLAGAAMALSSVTVVSNANRLRFFRAKSFAGIGRIGQSAKLPEGETVAVEFTPEEAGVIDFQCQMGMLPGKVVVKG